MERCVETYGLCALAYLQCSFDAIGSIEQLTSSIAADAARPGLPRQYCIMQHIPDLLVANVCQRISEAITC